MASRRCWLLKSEPDTFSIDDLERDQRTSWEGVRNYQARNFLREMRVGDRVLFYHSNAEPPGVAGLAQVVREAYPDSFAWDPASKYFDPASRPEDPRWFMVDVGFIERFDEPLPLPVLREDPALEGMELLRRGSRLSVQPVTEQQYDRVIQLARGRLAGVAAPPSAAGSPTAAKGAAKAGPKATKPSAKAVPKASAEPARKARKAAAKAGPKATKASAKAAPKPRSRTGR